MLHLAGGIALGVDVADLLKLERAFKSHREVGAAAEIKHVAGGRDEVGVAGDFLVTAKRVVHRLGRFLQVGDDLLLFRPV